MVFTMMKQWLEISGSAATVKHVPVWKKRKALFGLSQKYCPGNRPRQTPSET